MKKLLRSLRAAFGVHRRDDAARTRHARLRVFPVPVLTTGGLPACRMPASNEALFDPARTPRMDCGAEPCMPVLDATNAVRPLRRRVARPTRLGVLR